MILTPHIIEEFSLIEKRVIHMKRIFRNSHLQKLHILNIFWYPFKYSVQFEPCNSRAIYLKFS